MTSTTSSKGKFRQGLSFFLWSLYTGKTTMIIYLSLLTFFSLVTFVFSFGLSAQMPSQAKGITEGVSLFVYSFTEALAFVFTFVFAIKEFSYLHDKRKTDMFGALPVSRRTIFFSKLAAIIAQSTAPMLIIMTVIAIINSGSVRDYFSFSALFNAVNGEITELNLWYAMLRLFVGLVVNAVFIGFLSVCCGKTVDKILSYLIINAAYPIAALLVQAMPVSFVNGYSTEINEFFTCAFSPYMAMTTINPIYWGIFAIVFGALSFVLLPRRKAECAQSHFAFKAPLIITKLLVSFAAGMVIAYLFGLIFSAVGGDKIAFIIGMLIGSFTAYFVIQIIFAKGFKRFGWGMIPYAALVVCFGVIMLVVNTGLFGYESYVPNADEVESVSLIGDKQITIDGKNIITNSITDKAQIEECITGHKEAIEYCKKQDKSIAEMTFGNLTFAGSNNYLYSGDLTFCYKLKNGRTVTRNYGYFNENDISFMSSPTYLNNTNLLFLIDPKYCTDEVIYTDSDEDYEEEEYVSTIMVDGKEYPINEDYFEIRENREKLIEALRSDILTCGERKDLNICNIYFSYGNIDSFDFYESESITVYGAYKKTIELLIESGKGQTKI